MAVFSVYNGRMTRRQTTTLVRETQELIAREMLLRITVILGRIEERVR